MIGGLCIVVSDKRRYRESYIYSDNHDLVSNGGKNVSPRNKTPKSKQRCSVISDASSNTTSGIASDKMTISFDDSDGEYLVLEGHGEDLGRPNHIIQIKDMTASCTELEAYCFVHLLKDSNLSPILQEKCYNSLPM